MHSIPCQASRWANEAAEMYDREEAAYDAAADYLNANPDVANDYAQDVAKASDVDPESMEQEEWDRWVSDHWEDVVSLYMERQ